MCEHAAKPATTESKFQIEVPKAKVVLGTSIWNSDSDLVLGTPIWNSGFVDLRQFLELTDANDRFGQPGLSCLPG